MPNDGAGIPMGGIQVAPSARRRGPTDDADTAASVTATPTCLTKSRRVSWDASTRGARLARNALRYRRGVQLMVDSSQVRRASHSAFRPEPNTAASMPGLQTFEISGVVRALSCSDVGQMTLG